VSDRENEWSLDGRTWKSLVQEHLELDEQGYLELIEHGTVEMLKAMVAKAETLGDWERIMSEVDEIAPNIVERFIENALGESSTNDEADSDA
jgi:mannose/cellobiose epimerase-like protein (N-acyl-D-glucosamine 2-epimerase family)